MKKMVNTGVKELNHVKNAAMLIYHTAMLLVNVNQSHAVKHHLKHAL